MSVHLSEGDDGTTVEVALGDAVVVRLEENPTTGFRWTIDAVAGGSVAVADDDFEPANGGGIGAGGWRTLTFSATQPGSSRIDLKRWRDFEGDASVVERFSVTVRVLGGSSGRDAPVMAG